VAAPRSLTLVVVASLLCTACLLFALWWAPTAARYYEKPQPLQTGTWAPQYDFFQYYAGGHNWRAGFDPYRDHPGAPGALANGRGGGISGYIYPPTFLPVLGLLSRLDYDQARALWTALGLAALAVPLALGVWLARGRRLVTAALGILLIVASDPVLFHVRQGQTDMLVAGLAVSGFLLYGRARSVPAAVLLAAAVLIKVTPLVLVLATVAYYRDWRFLLKTLVAGLAVVAVSALLVHPSLYVEYVIRVMPTVSEGNPFFHNQSLLRGWSHLSEQLKYASLAAYALVVMVAWACGRERPTSRLERASGPPASADLQLLALVTVAVLLFSPLSWRMAYAGAVVPMALVLAAAPWTGRRWEYVLAAAGTVLMCLPVWDAPLLDSLETMGAGLAGAGLVAALAFKARPRGPAAGACSATLLRS
jgi:hypothetical protein